MPFLKSTGSTASEQYLARICERTFLHLWSYPNVFTDEGINRRNRHGRELCDLLVVCGEDILIFSDKSCQFPNTGKVSVDWKRWFKRSIKKSAKQAFGAEKWIRENPDRLFLDRSCTQKLPISFPDASKLHFHLILVAFGARARCREYCGGNGSLMLCPDIPYDFHSTAHNPPFILPGAQPLFTKQGMAHVFDDVTLNILLRELDTVSDLVGYLRKKEAFIQTGQLRFAAEEDLLAIFLSGLNAQKEHDFIITDQKPIVVQSDQWQRVTSGPNYEAAKLANRDSYIWDGIINSIATDALQGGLLSEGDTAIEKVEAALRIMAKESRLSRRMLSDQIIAKLKATPRNEGGARTFLPFPGSAGNVIYVLILRPFEGHRAEEYRRQRIRELTAYCSVVAWVHKEITHIVGIATESGENKGRSFDLAYLSIPNWTPEMDARCEKLSRETGYYNAKNILSSHHHDDEFPEPWSGERVTITPLAQNVFGYKTEDGFGSP